MEFYHTALVLRDMLTKWLMKEFGIKPSYKEYELRSSEISPEDLAVIDSIYEKYGINRKKAYASVYPQWLSEDEKLYFIRISRDMVKEIVMANSIYPICRIDKGFIFLKLKTRITSTGKVIRIPCRKNIIREKRKLRKLKRKGVEFCDIYTSYLSFRGNIRRYNSYRIVNSLDRYFSSIYGEEMENISVGERYGRKN